jgi:hypothetical protein
MKKIYSTLDAARSSTKRLRKRRTKNRVRRTFPNPRKFLEQDKSMRAMVKKFGSWKDAYREALRMRDQSSPGTTSFALWNETVKAFDRSRTIGPVKNPAPKGFALYARKRNGPKMVYNGRSFTNNDRPVVFPTVKSADDTGKFLIDAYPLLKNYALTVEPEKSGK